MNDKELLKELEKYDTPSVTNVVATYPGDEETCLGLYDPWVINWYTDSTLKCMYPELGRKAGFAVTCVVGLPNPGFKRLEWADVFRAIGAAGGPVVLAIKQDFPEEIKKKNGLSGGNLTTAFKACGAIGVISDGPSRDIDEIRPKDFQYMLTGVCAGHGDFAVKAVNVPVNICGMDISPGEIIHMDENGAVKFPRQVLPQVVEKIEKLLAGEADKQRRIADAAGDVEKIIRIMKGFE
ncbi:MAG: RraA family protein [Spirochaetales bacterium]|jgi:regulator of RNase E activity RraA|nr:RraA family protein [Spirochaetales bacterium]